MLFPNLRSFIQPLRLDRVGILTASCLFIVIVGCESVDVPPGPVKPTPPAIIEPDPRVDQLLNQAELALLRQRLTTPVDDNAYLRYLQVLAIDPDNLEAEAGLARIVEIYLSWASEAIQREDFRRAENMLNKAGSVDEQNPSIQSMRQRMSFVKAQERMTLRISQSELNSRSNDLQQKLAELATIAEERRAVAKIRARTDADARWIYQQMNLATESRIRATIESGVEPSVQLNFP